LVLRAIEEEGAKRRASQLAVHVPSAVALYILNYKRQNLVDIETRYGLSVLIRVDDQLGASNHRVEIAKGLSRAEDDADSDERDEQSPARREPRTRPQSQMRSAEEYEEQGGDEDGADSDGQKQNSTQTSQNPQDEERGSRRRRGRRGGRNRGRGRGERSDRVFDGENNGANDSASEDNALYSDHPFDAEESAEAQKLQHETPIASAEDSGESKPQAGKSKRAPSRRMQKKEHSETADPVSIEAATFSQERSEPSAPPPHKIYEQVNEPPQQPKKGWWNRFTE
jgi:ribonuclease E